MGSAEDVLRARAADAAASKEHEKEQHIGAMQFPLTWLRHEIELTLAWLEANNWPRGELRYVDVSHRDEERAVWLIYRTKGESRYGDFSTEFFLGSRGELYSKQAHDNSLQIIEIDTMPECGYTKELLESRFIQPIRRLRNY